MLNDNWYGKIDDVFPLLGDIPDDYFYNLEFDYLTLPEVQLLLLLVDIQKSFSFSGLKKKTSLHQQRLAKSLKRLQDRDLLIKDLNGNYELTHFGSKYTKDLISKLISDKALILSDTKTKTNFFSCFTIPALERSEIAQIFEKRWFNNFRYIYKKETETFHQLSWEDERNNELHLFIDNEGKLLLELRSNDDDNSELNYFLQWVRKELEINFNIHFLMRDNSTKTKKSNDTEMYI